MKAVGGRFVGRQADVRDEAGLAKALMDGESKLGPVDIIIANAGIAPLTIHESPDVWQDVIDINLTGVFHTVEVAVPSMVEAGKGGAIVLISSVAGLAGLGGGSRGGLAYSAAKHGLVGLMRSYANELARHSIRVNSVHPTGVNTTMVANDAIEEFMRHHPFGGGNPLPVSMLESIDITNALLWLVSDDARYVTGVTLPVDAGSLNRRSVYSAVRLVTVG